MTKDEIRAICEKHFKKERGFKKYRFISRSVAKLVTPPFGASSNTAPLEGQYQTTS